MKEACLSVFASGPGHGPYGIGVGAKPGRVVWFHDKDSVDWDGNGYWWDTANFDESAIQNMLDQSIASLAGKADGKERWDALFLANNSARGKAASYTNPVLLKWSKAKTVKTKSQLRFIERP